MVAAAPRWNQYNIDTINGIKEIIKRKMTVEKIEVFDYCILRGYSIQWTSRVISILERQGEIVVDGKVLMDAEFAKGMIIKKYVDQIK